MFLKGFPTSLRGWGRSGGLPQLRSSLNTPLSSRKSTKSALSKLYASGTTTDRTETSKVEQTVSDALTDEYRAQLEAQAQKDAAAGVYNQNGTATALRNAQMEKAVSPDRDAAIAQASRVLVTSSFHGSGGSITTRLSGLPYTVTVSKNAYRTSAEITDESGAAIASYDSRVGEWRNVTTKAERQFETASSAIYDEAYRKAGEQPAAVSAFDQRV